MHLSYENGTKTELQAALEALQQDDRLPLDRWLREHLFNHVLPFWEKHAFDEKGGLLTCLRDDGTLISRDKWLWSQWRAVWVFSRIYNRISPDKRWLNYAEEIAAFCIRTGWDKTRNGWHLAVDENGKVLRGYESTYVDAFAVCGLAELYRANHSNEIARLARLTADSSLKTLAGPYDRIPHFPYPIPKNAKPHGIPMLWSMALAELGDVLLEERYLQASTQLSNEIFRDFYRKDRDLIVEFVQLNGLEFPVPTGTAVVPGHVIEDMWFQIHNNRLRQQSSERTPEFLRLMLRHLERGWDKGQQAGILLAVDADEKMPVGWNFADTKLWWPHTEALYGTLLGWTSTKQQVWLDWYSQIWKLCLDHFSDWEHGEWRQRLGRDLKPINDVVALPVKDPFHLPRSLILQIEALKEE